MKAKLLPIIALLLAAVTQGVEAQAQTRVANR